MPLPEVSTDVLTFQSAVLLLVALVDVPTVDGWPATTQSAIVGHDTPSSPWGGAGDETGVLVQSKT
jgi:hypothetical protein